jgi:hypothetical protein
MEDKGEYEHHNPTEFSKSFWKKAGLAVGSLSFLGASGLSSASAGFALASGSEQEAILKGGLSLAWGALSVGHAFALGRMSKK